MFECMPATTPNVSEVVLPDISALRRQGVDSVPDLELLADFEHLHRAGEAIEAERLRRLAEIERRGLHRHDGYLSAKAWLADRFKVAAGTAKEQVRVAQALAEMPEVSASFSSGDISSSAVRVLAEAKSAHPEAFAAQEQALVEAATGRPVAELQRVVTEWSQAVDSERALEQVERLRESRRLDLCPTSDGMVRVQGDLDPESGEAVMTAIGAICDAAIHSGGNAAWRNPAQTRADALTELAHRYLDSRDRPIVAGERPNVTVTVGIDTLRASRDDGQAVQSGEARIEGHFEAREAQLDHTGAIHPEMARRLACDANVRRVVLNPRSEPLDVGRKTSVIPPGLRRAVVVRDGSCKFPGCDRPPPWCDAHHVVHWARGGPTAIHNLILLCRQHHLLVHEGGFGLRMESGRPIFTRPDGSVLP